MLHIRHLYVYSMDDSMKSINLLFVIQSTWSCFPELDEKVTPSYFRGRLTNETHASFKCILYQIYAGRIFGKPVRIDIASFSLANIRNGVCEYHTYTTPTYSACKLINQPSFHRMWSVPMYANCRGCIYILRHTCIQYIYIYIHICVYVCVCMHTHVF